MARPIADLPNALEAGDELARLRGGRTPAVFLDYDGTLTPIVGRPEDAVISAGMRETVRRLARRCPVCVVSGRDRRVVQELMGLDDLVVAGSHGFDIWSPAGGAVGRDLGAAHRGLIREVEARLRHDAAGVEGAFVEPKSASVALHYRHVPEEQRPRLRRIVDAVLAEHRGELKVTAGKLVYEVQPGIDWDKGKAVLHLLAALDLDAGAYLPLYLGDDLTDEDAFHALADRGVGILVGRADDPELAGRSTEASYVLAGTGEVEEFLGRLAGAVGEPGS